MKTLGSLPSGHKLRKIFLEYELVLSGERCSKSYQYVQCRTRNKKVSDKKRQAEISRKIRNSGGSRYYTEVRVERAHSQNKKLPAWTTFPVSYR